MKNRNRIAKKNPTLAKKKTHVAKPEYITKVGTLVNTKLKTKKMEHWSQIEHIQLKVELMHMLSQRTCC